MTEKDYISPIELKDKMPDSKAHGDQPVGDYQFLYYELERGSDEHVKENRNESTENGATSVFYELLSPDGIHFWYGRGSAPFKNSLLIETASDFVQLCFSVSGQWRYRNEESGSELRFGTHEYNLLYFRPQRFMAEGLGGEEMEVFAVNLVPELFERYLPETHPFAAVMKSTGQAEPLSILNSYHLPLTPRIKSILFEILHCPLENYYKRLYLRAKVVELVIMVLSHAEEYKPTASGNTAGLRREDIEKMQQAREILHHNLQNPCSLIDLAHQVGTNENYLKKHFKQVFGNTVYGYVQELRMEQARKLLMEGEHDIQEVARLTGFKQTHYFVAVFKKYFGYAPTQLKGREEK